MVHLVIYPLAGRKLALDSRIFRSDHSVPSQNCKPCKHISVLYNSCGCGWKTLSCEVVTGHKHRVWVSNFVSSVGNEYPASAICFTLSGVQQQQTLRGNWGLYTYMWNAHAVGGNRCAWVEESCEIKQLQQNYTSGQQLHQSCKDNSWFSPTFMLSPHSGCPSTPPP